MKRRVPSFLLLAAGFFALYALTAQRGTGWGDSAEFQEWVLGGASLVCGPHFSNAHPFYVGFCRLVASGPTAVTLVSSFFGAISVALLFLCTDRLALAVLFGLSQMAWWLSTVAEVQTMNLAFTAFETWCLVECGRSGRRALAWLCAAALAAGVHLCVHNFALLALPVYAFFLVRFALARRGADRAVAALAPLACWAAGASYWLWNLAARGPADVLYGAYGAKVAGALPESWTATAFNFALVSLSFAVPAAVAWWERRRVRWVEGAADHMLLALFAVNFVFFVRYFVPDQSQFVLPTLFYAYMLLRKASVSRTRLAALAAVQVLLPVFAYFVARELPTPAERQDRHPGRDDARYFILPWKA